MSEDKSNQVRLGNRRIKLPRSRILRITIGVLLIIGGFLGFLPILGFWMLPLGIIVLSVDIPLARRIRRRIEIWWGRRRNKKSKERPKDHA